MRCFTAWGVTFWLAAALLSGACDETRESRTITRSVELDNAESVDVELTVRAGELKITGGSTRLLDAGFRFNVPSWEPVVNYRNAGGRGSLTIDQPDASVSFGHTENHWDLAFNDTVPIALTAHMGAGQATMTLGTLNLSSLELQQGAGEMSVDLRGTPKRSYDVRVNGGVGQTHIRLPRSVAIVATAMGGIGSVDVRGLDKRDGTWVNREHENDPVAIHLDVKTGVGETIISAE